MQTQELGKSGLKVAPWAFGGNVFGWTADQSASFQLLDAFVGHGFSLIDSADVYSRWAPGHSGGESETMIGDWLAQGGAKERASRREKVVIATKLGNPMPEGQGLSRGYMMEAVERSLKRLKTDYIDLYQSHVDDASVPLEETLSAFGELIKAGKVRAIGASNYGAPRLAEALKLAKDKGLPRYETLQPWYNLYDRDVFEGPVQDLARAEGLGVIPYFGLASGFLTGKYRSEADLVGSPRAYRAKDMLDKRGMRILAALDAVGARVGGTPAQVSLSWLRAKGCIPIASATKLSQLEELAKFVDLTLDADAVATLDKASVINPGEEPVRAPPPRPSTATKD
ncbi:MAG TPA: aldo/keto reductase [Caulobacteraceae bacterium]